MEQRENTLGASSTVAKGKNETQESGDCYHGNVLKISGFGMIVEIM